jgi:mannosyl-oligosaccharide glucosidase
LKLRNNVQNTILKSYHKTNYFWEQYKDINGEGMRGHPFSGWTALIINIMAEKY